MKLDFEIIQKAIPIKTHLQNAIVELLTQEELFDIWKSNLNENVIEKLISLAHPYYNESPTSETLDILALSIGTIIKEYEWGTYYLSNDGIQELKRRIASEETNRKPNSSVIEDLLDGNNFPTGELIKFNSTGHIRYVNGVNVSGHNFDCNRQIEVQKNIDGGEGYTVTIYNLDSMHPLWGNNVQMAPKQMRIIEKRRDMVSLRGFGYDRMGGSFSDYAIDIYFEEKQMEKIVLKMLDRNIELEYLK